MAEVVRRSVREGGGLRQKTWGQFPANVVGQRYGRRVIVAELPPRHRARYVRLLCDCGAYSETLLSNVPRSPGCRRCCHRGPRVVTLEREITTETAGILREARERCPEVWLDDGGGFDRGLSDEDRRWNEQVRRDAVAELVGVTGALSLAETGELFDVTRERIRQIEYRATHGRRKALRRRCELVGLRPPDPRRATMAELTELHSSAWGGEEDAA